jgi:Flp pilus assembly protein TadG
VRCTGTRLGERGSTAIQVLVILVPVFFGFMGFAIDLGRLYLVRGELKTAANAMALAAASRLIGTDASTTDANGSAQLAIENTGGFANRYDFGGITIGQGSGRLTSATPEPQFFENASDATGEGGGGQEAGATTARYVRVDITADAPLIFWGLLSLGQERKTPIAARAVAGISAPLCLACGIEPIAVAPLDPEDTTNYGFTVGQRYTLGYQCTGAPQPAGLNATQRIPYLLLNRYNEEATLFPDETSQAYRMGAGGMPGSTNPAMSCLRISDQVPIWATAAPTACQQNNVPQTVRAFTCGLNSRFDTALPVACEQISEAATIITAYSSDSDVTDLEDYAAYSGNTRRVITIAIAELLDAASPMNIVGFRQFLIQPTQGADTAGVPSNDQNGRFTVTYLGSPLPLRSGSFGGCTVTAGPGKVVLHQ